MSQRPDDYAGGDRDAAEAERKNREQAERKNREQAERKNREKERKKGGG